MIAAIAYGLFLAVVLWAITFLANLDVLTTINGPAESSWQLDSAALLLPLTRPARELADRFTRAFAGTATVPELIDAV